MKTEDVTHKVLTNYETEISVLEKSKIQLTKDLIELRMQFTMLAVEYEHTIPAKSIAYKYAAKKVNDLIEWHDLKV